MPRATQHRPERKTQPMSPQTLPPADEQHNFAQLTHLNDKSPLDAALAYAKVGWRVLPIYPVSKSGTCRCFRGANCPSPGKHPALVEHGVKDATTDAEQIEAWWQEYPDAN